MLLDVEGNDVEEEKDDDDDDDGAVAEEGVDIDGGEGGCACLVSNAMRTRMSSKGYVHATDIMPVIVSEKNITRQRIDTDQI